MFLFASKSQAFNSKSTYYYYIGLLFVETRRNRQFFLRILVEEFVG